MNLAASDPALIGIDWGTSSLRAFLLDADGAVLDQVSSAEGITKVKNHGFEKVFNALVDAWVVHGPLPVVASGMITSRNGWIETPYAAMPVDSEDLANALVLFETGCGRQIHFVTGASIEHDGHPDVMRGEETQIVGAAASGIQDGVFVMPGTHSKWVRVRNGRIDDFATYMTGDVFAALKEHTILGALMDGSDPHPASFKAGVEAGLTAKADLLHRIFHVRTLPLMERIPQTGTSDYLSGLLIGSEIASASEQEHTTDVVTIIGRSDLADRYETALQIAGHACLRSPDDIVAVGHFEIAKAAGLVA
jgi:2-dehydro-3-deoxygalactonokinase